MTNDTLAWLNRCERVQAVDAFRSCCAADAWAQRMADARPFADADTLHAAGEAAFDGLSAADWTQALESHPRIGDLDSLRMKLTGNRQWSAGEQSGVSAADEAVLVALAEGNRAYEERFGRTFIVCATGRSAEEMLAILRQRLASEPAAEFAAATAEQRKITRLRLDKLRHPG